MKLFEEEAKVGEITQKMSKNEENNRALNLELGYNFI
jgi:hypothetical protein